MDKPTVRNRKTKGSLSVLDEFTGENDGAIKFNPQISADIQYQIDERTKFADIPKNHSEIQEQNLGQTSDKPRTISRTNFGQTSDKPRTNDLDSADNLSKPKSELRTISRTNLGQTSDKPRTISAFQALSGLQKNITFLLYEFCVSKGSRTTGPLSIAILCEQLGSPPLSIQKSIQRLELKSILIRKEFRVGRGGWTIYEIPELVWNEILQTLTSDKPRTNLGQTSDKPKSEPRTELRTSTSSSSSRYLINTTTQDTVLDKGRDFSEFNFQPVSEFGISE
jgi:hypothetical protein